MSKLDELAKQSPEATRELVQLRAENARLQATIDEANKQEPYGSIVSFDFNDPKFGVAIVNHSGSELSIGAKLYARPIPANRARITEQDALEIIDNYRNSDFSRFALKLDEIFRYWLMGGGQLLLNKLNADRQPTSPADSEGGK